MKCQCEGMDYFGFFSDKNVYYHGNIFFTLIKIRARFLVDKMSLLINRATIMPFKTLGITLIKHTADFLKASVNI